MGTYVVGDIHGCYSSWLELKNKIEKQDKDALFILVGDIVDRGPEVFQMLMWAMKNITSDGKYQMIIGNHEVEKLGILEEYFAHSRNLEEDNYLVEDLFELERDHYDFKDCMISNMVSTKLLYQIYQFFRTLPLYKERDITMQKKKQHYIIVHGGLPSNCINKNETFKKRSINVQTTNEENRYKNYRNCDDIIWMRSMIGNPFLKKTIVVHGHTPTIASTAINSGAVPGKISYHDHDINIDCGEVFRNTTIAKGNLAAIRLEDLEEFYVHTENDDSIMKMDFMDIFIKRNEERKAEMLERWK